MANNKKGLLTQTKSWDKHLRKIGKRIFWKTERPAERKMIEQNLAEFETQTLSEDETESAKQLYDYLNIQLPNSLNYAELYNLYYSLFCTLDILPENIKSLKLTKEVLSLTFVKLSSKKNITKLVSNNNITDKNYWIEQTAISMRTDKVPNHENARILIGNK
ncbi:hypothetical protein [Algibacter lectus]|uniref:Uncharacterized protein n=1 Tax=Algibacter lectus TaxID=221126 RepID=A0A090VJK4_9FLAO|nr:hypothetical protein [Algibacter lectus]GAL63484.1 hypothetical protein JCM19300_1830 [Algibacter lectus]